VLRVPFAVFRHVFRCCFTRKSGSKASVTMNSNWSLHRDKESLQGFKAKPNNPDEGFGTAQLSAGSPIATLS